MNMMPQTYVLSNEIKHTENKSTKYFKRASVQCSKCYIAILIKQIIYTVSQKKHVTTFFAIT